MRTVIRLILSLSRLLFGLLVRGIEGLLFVAVGLVRGGRVVHDAVKAFPSWSTGVLHCPQGHVIELDDDTLWRCEACKFQWRGRAPFRCPNVECPAPDTAFLDCRICGASTRNPLRWGRP